MKNLLVNVNNEDRFMKIKIGTIKKDPTAYGNKYYIQIEDNAICSNSDLEDILNEQVTVVIGRVSVINNLLEEIPIGKNEL